MERTDTKRHDEYQGFIIHAMCYRKKGNCTGDYDFQATFMKRLEELWRLKRHLVATTIRPDETEI